MPLCSLDPREGNQDVNIFYDETNQFWCFRRQYDDVPTVGYSTAEFALNAARRLSGLSHIHMQPCEKFESPYAANGPGVWHTNQLECIVCYWPGYAHAHEAA